MTNKERAPEKYKQEICCAEKNVSLPSLALISQTMTLENSLSDIE